MAEPLLRKTFAKLRARRRKSVKGGRSEDSEASETMAVGASGGSVQATNCVIGEAQSEGGCAASPCRNPREPAPSCSADRGVDCSSRPDCASSMAGRCGQEQDCQPPRLGCSEARKSKRAVGEGEIWYNPIPEDENVALVPRRAGPSKAQWYVEMSCPKETETGPSATRPRCASPLTMLEPQAMKCSAETSPPKARAHLVQASAVAWTCSQLGSWSQKPQASDGPAAEPPPYSGRAAGPSPRPEKTGVAAQRSPPDRGKSPGTVRRLSLRMRKLPELRRKLSLRGPSRSGRHDRDGSGESGRSPSPPRAASRRNVICRYHLDSSVGARGGRQQASLSQRGYLSDGHSPEPVPKADGAPSHWPQRGALLDTSAFRPYNGNEQPRCLHHLSGLLNIRLLGLQAIRSPRAGPADIFCSIQVDSVSKARTALLSCPDPFLSLDHTFNIELEGSQQLQLLVFTWDPGSCSNRVCCHGTALLPPLFRGARSHQLAMQLEPRGILYMKVSLVEARDISACCTDEHREPRVFRMELKELVERERSGVSVPLLIQKCVSEIEKRGLKAVGLYRLCGSAAIKKELRDSFERDSSSVELSEEIYPDINVITGILKDYLRELPSPLITRTLYDVVLEATTTKPLKISNGVPDASLCSVNTVALLDCLPQAEKATLTLLLDHLSLVASLQESNKMTCQNLAVCFGPVLLGQKQENPQQGGSCSFSHSKELASALDFKRHIEVLHYLLQLWPRKYPAWLHHRL
ncbi:rho GTPase-activating protein SYDE2-like isoform X2 [Narcine bancroftii]|uniref:rho GTPase-activating protein SYDE2-like isoform X2 n=1 Tax=Narcine bancroftii TaxID=1343680 RepID=UPI00383129D4